MTMVNLKEALGNWLNSDEPVGRETVETLRAAGLIAPAGFQITEIGRTLMLQASDQTFGKLAPGSVLYTPRPEPMHVKAFANTLAPEDVCSAKDVQIGGDHYKKLGRHQPWEVLGTWLTPEELRGYMKGTVIAYLAREQDKGGDLDIEKSAHTMQLWQEVRKDKKDANPDK